MNDSVPLCLYVYGSAQSVNSQLKVSQRVAPKGFASFLRRSQTASSERYFTKPAVWESQCDIKVTCTTTETQLLERRRQDLRLMLYLLPENRLHAPFSLRSTSFLFLLLLVMHPRYVEFNIQILLGVRENRTKRRLFRRLFPKSK